MLREHVPRGTKVGGGGGWGLQKEPKYNWIISIVSR